MGWISVKDRLPEHNKRVLVAASDVLLVDVDSEVSEWVCIAIVYICPEYGNLIWEDDNEEDFHLSPTHWMPLPEPPKGE